MGCLLLGFADLLQFFLVTCNSGDERLHLLWLAGPSMFAARCSSIWGSSSALAGMHLEQKYRQSDTSSSSVLVTPRLVTLQRQSPPALAASVSLAWQTSSYLLEDLPLVSTQSWLLKQ